MLTYVETGHVDSYYGTAHA